MSFCPKIIKCLIRILLIENSKYIISYSSQEKKLFILIVYQLFSLDGV